VVAKRRGRKRSRCPEYGPEDRLIVGIMNGILFTALGYLGLFYIIEVVPFLFTLIFGD
jgi:hypothetical protein